MKTIARLFVWACLAAAAARSAQAAVLIDFAPAGEPRSVKFFDYHSSGPCVTWSFLGQEGATLWVLGRPTTPCPDGSQAVQLPSLGKGRYRLVATLSNGEVWDEASFAVGAEEQLPATLIDLSPAAPGPTEALAIVVSGLQFEFPGSLHFVDEPTIEGSRIVFSGELTFCPFICPAPPLIGYEGHRYLLPPLTPGLKTVVLEAEGEVIAERSFTVGPPGGSLRLNDDRFEVALAWKDHGGEEHAASAEALTDDSGSFWFFHRDNVELTVKILDGRAVNGAFWLFAASMTDLAYTLTVTDRHLSTSRVYQRRAGGSHNVIDTDLFGSH
jgi:hypothetical protein